MKKKNPRDLLVSTYRKAQEILEKNSYQVTINNNQYRRSIPSWDYYRHQWFWDSCIHARALVHVHPDWAFQDIESLISGQWENGLIGHITFNPDEKNYFPGPEFWETEKFSKNSVVATGIIQPPLLAESVSYIYKYASDKEKAEQFLEKVLPAVIKYHTYLKMFRDGEDSGLISIVHPWESGADNSPCWDDVFQQITISNIPQDVIDIVHKYRKDNTVGAAQDRPKLEDYYRYIYLITLYKSWGWDYETIIKKSPFVVKDIHTNSIWCRANEALGEILQDLGRGEEAINFFDWADQTRKAIQNCWDKDAKLFVTKSVGNANKNIIKEDTFTSFMPLYAGAVDDKLLPVLFDLLTDTTTYWSAYPVPSTSLRSPKYELSRYWRGPVWPIINYLLIEGLNSYQNEGKALQIRDELLKKTCEMISEFGFHEHYDPVYGLAPTYRNTGGGMGFQSFTWSAAIFILLVEKYGLSSIESSSK